MLSVGKIIEYINNESEKECKAIAAKAHKEGAKLQFVYSKKEEDAYTTSMNEGKEKIVMRVEQLSKLADEQAQKMVQDAEKNVLNDVLDLTAKKLSALPSQEYSALLKRLGIEEGCKPEYLVELYREELSKSVVSAVFGTVSP